MRKDITFEIKIPNKITSETFKKTDKGKELESFKSVEALFKDLKN